MNWNKLRSIWSLPTLRCTDNARRCLSIAWNIAEKLNHDSVNSEHLLAALIYQSMKSSRTILSRLELRWSEQDAVGLIGPARSEIRRSPLTFDPSVRALLKNAAAQARSLNHAYVGTEHLVLALLVGPSSPSRDFLNAQGLSPDDIRSAVTHNSA